MQSQTNHRRTLEERLILGAIVFTYPIYAIGGLYITGSLLAWCVMLLVLLRAFMEGHNPFSDIPKVLWFWVAGMAVMLIALWVAHGNWSLGTTQTIKSSVGWAKGWALLALFPLLGAIVNVRPEILIRSVCIVSKHTAIFAMVTFVLYLIKVPGHLFTSPLMVIGGAGEIFFNVSLYGLNPETGAGRWQFFAPWAPAAGLLSCIFVVICLLEKDKRWRNWGVFGCAVMMLLCQSRAGWAIFAVIVPLFLFSRYSFNPWVLITVGFTIPLLIVVGEPIVEYVMDAHQQIKEARPASTRVRTALENIAFQRWQDEAPIWGHGIVESGPKLVEFMPIGSHHSWFGLLFVKGIVGLLSLAIPLAVSIFVLLLNQHRSSYVRAGLCMMLVITCYSFFENIEILVYLVWPAFFWLGLCLKQLKEIQNG